MDQKQYSAACERNSAPILAQLQLHFQDAKNVLEIGSGTGQHAVYFARHLPQLCWHTSDRLENHGSIDAWIDESKLTNVQRPFELDVGKIWPERQFDGAFTANTCHIMAWSEVEKMFHGVARVLGPHACFVVYGPLNYQGQYTSTSNETFDCGLRNRAAHMGIRDFEAIASLALENGLMLQIDQEMPANNRLLVFKKTTNTFPEPKTD